MRQTPFRNLLTEGRSQAYCVNGFRQDLIALFDLLQQQKIKPLIAQRFPLAESRHAQELLGKGGVIGKIVRVPNGSSLRSGVINGMQRTARH